MLKWDLIKEVAERHPYLSPQDAEVIVNRFLDGLTKALAKGEGVEIRGFGSFGVKHRPARERRNPKTGVMVSLAASKAPFFRAAKELRLRVNRKWPATTG